MCNAQDPYPDAHDVASESAPYSGATKLIIGALRGSPLGEVDRSACGSVLRQPVRVFDDTLHEVGRVQRTLFTVRWFEDPALRRLVTAELNKGEARNSLARAVASIASALPRTAVTRTSSTSGGPHSRDGRHRPVQLPLPRPGARRDEIARNADRREAYPAVREATRKKVTKSRQTGSRALGDGGAGGFAGSWWAKGTRGARNACERQGRR